MRIIRKIRCPHCDTVNSVGLGVVGAYCENCGAYFVLEGKLSEQAWAPKNFFERLIDRFSTPKSIIISSIVLLVLFVGFWGVLHFQTTGSAKHASAPVEVTPEDNSPETQNSVTPPASLPVVVAPPPPPPVHPLTQPAVATTAPTSKPIVVIRPVPHPLPGQMNSLDDKQVGDAISRGAHFLMSAYDPKTHLVKGDPAYQTAEDALCAYALLQCNDAITDPELTPRSDFMGPAIDAMKRQIMDPRSETYGRSLRANALALIDRSVDRAVLVRDVQWLQSASREGAYTYGMPAPGPPTQSLNWDNSNSQYGLLGVWAGNEVGVSIPNSYWFAVQKHWLNCQSADGSFGYQQGRPGTLSMTAAGVASLCIVHDCLAPSATIGVDSRSMALIKALAWMNDGDHIMALPNDAHFGTYTLYGVARAGLASGYKFFGKHDWYTELALPQLAGQQKDGSFGDPIDTSLTLLFLARGRHPVLFNKLTIDGVVLDHPRDISNLARYATRELEHTFNAQLVPIATNWRAWTESPVLYLAAAWAPFISGDQCDQLRNFVRAGGLLFTHADGNSQTFNAFAEKLAQRLFPEYPYQDLPPDHPLYHALFKLDAPPPLKGVSNGARLLMVNSPRDVARAWDVHDWQKVEPAYQLGLNIFLYAAGKRDFHNRLDTTYVPAPTAKPDVTINVARLRYSGNWDPEPYAWTRFARGFQWKTSFAANVQSVDIKDLNAERNPIADLTGTDAHQFSYDELNAIRNYVRSGGVLLIDSCGGNPDFASSQSGLLSVLIPDAQAAPIPATHPLVNGIGPCMDRLTEPVGRDMAETPEMPEMISFGRGHIIYTPLDLTNALLGTSTLGIKGYHHVYAEALIKNLLLWVYNGQPDQ